jgi:hypothetical protein
MVAAEEDRHGVAACFIGGVGDRRRPGDDFGQRLERRLPCDTLRMATGCTVPRSSTSWPRSVSVVTSPAVRSALGPISQPSRPAPSCTGAPRILHRMKALLETLHQLSLECRRNEQAELANPCDCLINMAGSFFEMASPWMCSTKGW